MSLPRRVHVTEVVTRDGFQSEPGFVPTATKIALIEAFAACGVPRLEATSFVSPRAVPQLADAEEVIRGLARPRRATIAGLVPNARGAARALSAGIDELVPIVSASESHSRANANCSIAEALEHFTTVVETAAAAGVPVHGGIGVAFGCPFEGEVPAARVVELVDAMVRNGVRAFTLGDTTGMATPAVVARTCGAIRDAHPDVELTLHFHNTRGIGLVNVVAGLQLGIDRYESTSGGLGGCPFAPGATGNVCTEDLVYLVHELGIETGIDLDGLILLARRIEALVGRPLPGQVMRAGPRLRVQSLDAARRAIG